MLKCHGHPSVPLKGMDMKKIYISHNKYQVPDATPGVCPGASANWVKEAIAGNYETNPTTVGPRLESTKSLTTLFCKRKKHVFDNLVDLLSDVKIIGAKITPNAFATRTLLPFKFNTGHIERLAAKHYNIEGEHYYKITETIKLLTPLKGQTLEETLFIQAVKDKLPNSRKYDAFILGQAARKNYTDKSGEVVVGHVTKHSGIYIMVTGTHIMAASSESGSCYFYDVENGLFACSNADELYRTIMLRY